jgi:protein-S-isoprenylcysteine O-methyltransferase Ste14
MSREAAIQWVCLYGPLVSAGLLMWWVRPKKLQATGLLFAIAWNAALLPWLDGIAQQLGLWSYHSSTPSLGGMPLALYFGWVIGWGWVTPLLAHVIGHRRGMAIALMVAIDLRTMPEMQPTLELSSDWWIGEVAIASLLLLPSVFLADWTAARTHTGWRCMMLVPAFCGIFLGIPLLVESGDLSGVIARWQHQPDFLKFTFVSAMSILTLPGLVAVRDLVLSGDGTPVPFDPPRRLVTHGVYAFMRNPMQFSMTSLLMLESWFLMSPWPIILAAMGMIYSEGIARWSENQDMRERFGDAWSAYHASVRPWIPRWYPRIGEPCGLWLDRACSPCTDVEHWFRNRNPHQLVFHDAKNWPNGKLERVMWHHPPSGRSESGVRAIAMALQHLDLRWAILGWIAGLPFISNILQICFDAAGAGKRVSSN